MLQSPAVSTNETLDQLRRFNGATPSLKDITGISSTRGSPEIGGAGHVLATGTSLTSASKAIISFIDMDTSTELLLDVGKTDAPCAMGVGASNFLKARYMSGSWRNPATGDLYVADSGCGLLYRYTNATFVDPALNSSCNPFGSCGFRHGFANLTADFQMDLGQRTSVVGDINNGLLYIAYGNQCGIMSYNLTSGSKIGFVTSINLSLNATFSVTIPVCGYAGESLVA